MAEQDVRAVTIAHETFWQSYAKRDLARRFSVCAEDVTFFGTGQHERAVGKEAYYEMNRKGVEQYPEPFVIETLWKDVRVNGNTAWVESDTLWLQQMEDGQLSKDLRRLTTIFRLEEGVWLVVHVHGSEPDYRLKEGEYMVNAGVWQRNRELERQVRSRTDELNSEKSRSENLLLNILPEAVAEELKTTGKAVARHYDNVTVLFTDFKNFTQMTETLSPKELVEELNACFTAFDGLLEKYRVEKIKTVGDAYVAVAGLPTPDTDHAVNAVGMALEIRDLVDQRKAMLGDRGFDIRIGVHSGEVVAGIVGVKKFQYDIWGDTVNIAARMEECCDAGQVNISGTTHALVKEHFRCTYRGEIEAKHKGLRKMYFADRMDG